MTPEEIISPLGQPLEPQDLAVIAAVVMRRVRALAGEAEGHAFHGNQWTEGAALYPEIEGVFADPRALLGGRDLATLRPSLQRVWDPTAFQRVMTNAVEDQLKKVGFTSNYADIDPNVGQRSDAAGFFYPSNRKIGFHNSVMIDLERAITTGKWDEASASALKVVTHELLHAASGYSSTDYTGNSDVREVKLQRKLLEEGVVERVARDVTSSMTGGVKGHTSYDSYVKALGVFATPEELRRAVKMDYADRNKFLGEAVARKLEGKTLWPPKDAQGNTIERVDNSTVYYTDQRRAWDEDPARHIVAATADPKTMKLALERLDGPELRHTLQELSYGATSTDFRSVDRARERVMLPEERAAKVAQRVAWEAEVTKHEAESRRLDAAGSKLAEFARRQSAAAKIKKRATQVRKMRKRAA